MFGKAKLEVDIVAKGNPEIRPETPLKPSEICIHNTGNSGRGADAEAHRRYLHNMGKLQPKDTGYASYHFIVDHDSIIQLLPLDECAWHTGDGSGSKSGNRNAIGVEICENSDMTPAQYAQAEENAVALTAYLMKELGIKIEKVKPHQAYSGKYCPRVILKRDGSFSKFNGRVKSAHAKLTAPVVKPVASKPVVKTASKPVGKPVTVKKPTTTSLTADVFGTLKVVVDKLNVRESANLNSKVVKVVDKGDTFKVYAQKNGLYHLGGNQYCTSNSKYVQFTKNPSFGVVPKTKFVTVLVSELYTYKTADWNDKGEIVKKNQVFTVAKELTVAGSKMYQLKSGLYISANPKYVKVTAK